MRKLSLLFITATLAVTAHAQVAISASSITDAFGHKIPSARLCFTPVNAAQQPTGFRVGAIQVNPVQACGLITQGYLTGSGVWVANDPTANGTNLVPDPAITSFTTWSNPGGAWAINPIGAAPYFGANQINVTAGTYSTVQHTTSAAFTVVPGTTYTLSGGIDATFVTSGTPLWEVEITNGVTPLYYGAIMQPGQAGFASVQFTPPSGYTTAFVIAATGVGTTVATSPGFRFYAPVLQSGGLAVVPNITGTYYHIQLLAANTNQVIRDYGMTPITGSAFTMDTYDISMATLPVSAITVGTVTPLAPGTPPTATITPGSPALLNLGIPSGANGTNGTNGTNGAAGATGATGATGGITGGALTGQLTSNVTLPTGAPTHTIGSQVFYSPNMPQEVLAFGAVPDERDLLDCSVTASGTTLSCPDGAFTTADSTRKALVAMGSQSVVNATITAIAPITVTGTPHQYCTVTLTGGGGSGATGFIYLYGTNSVNNGVDTTAAIYMKTFGTGFTSAPTAGTVSNGNATCSGTVALTSQLAAAPVLVSLTYASGTTVTMSSASTISGSGAVFASIGSDNTVAINACITQAQSLVGAASCHLSPGQYLTTAPITISSPVHFYGEGSFENWGNQSMTGYSDIMPQFAPYLTGSVIVDASPNADDALDANVGGDLYLRDFGIRFAPPAAFWHTGEGVKLVDAVSITGGFGEGVNGGEVSHVHVWGNMGGPVDTTTGSGSTDYAFEFDDTALLDIHGLRGYGGGGIHFYEHTHALCCAGNHTVTDTQFNNMTGSSSGYYFDSGSGASNPNNLITLIRPQSNLYPITVYGSSPLLGWPIPIANGWAMANIYAPGTPQLAIIAPDWEGSGSHGGAGPLGNGFQQYPQRSDFASFGGDVSTILPTISQIPGYAAPITLTNVWNTTAVSIVGPAAFAGNVTALFLTPNTTFATGGVLMAAGADNTTNYDSAQFGWHSVSSGTVAGNTGNFGFVGMFGVPNEITWWPNGFVGINTGSTAPGFPLTVAGETSIALTTGSTALQVTNSAAVGGFADISRMYFSAPNTGSDLLLRVGSAYSTNNDATIGLHYAGAGSSSNFGWLGMWGLTDAITWFPSGNVGIGMGTTAPSFKFQVSGTSAATGFQVTSGAQTVYRCTTAGTLPVGALTTVTGNCGASTAIGITSL